MEFLNWKYLLNKLTRKFESQLDIHDRLEKPKKQIMIQQISQIYDFRLELNHSK